MTEQIKDVNAKIDEVEAAAKKYASKDTVISIGGYEFTPAKLMVAFTIVSSTLGSLYGAFEVYKDYQSMKKKIAEYSAPDLSGFDKRLAVIEENSAKSTDYTRDIKNDLKGDIRRTETVAEQVERSVKQAQRETDQDLKGVRSDVRTTLDRTREEMDRVKQDMERVKKETDAKMEKIARDLENRLDRLNKDVDNRIQKAVDNPLANK
jgi:exonuclease VII large subunit